MNELQKYLFITNPVAGGQNKEDIMTYVASYPNLNSPEILYTQPNTKLNWDKLDSKPTILVAVGGDGTVAEAAELARQGNVPLGIIPMGSGNGLAKDMGISLDPYQALRHIIQGKVTAFDSFYINERLALHMADVGLNAHIIEEYAQYPFRTLGSYAVHMLRCFLTHDAKPMRLFVDAALVWAGQAYMVAFCNGRSYGSNLILNPVGNLADGQIEAIVVPEFSKTLGPALYLELLNGELDPAYFISFAGSRFTLATEYPSQWQADGEFLGNESNFTIKVMPSSVLIIK